MRSLAFLAIVLMASSAAAGAEPTAAVKKTYSRGEALCKNMSLSTLTGKSPWLAMGVGGAYEYFQASEAERANLGFFAQPAVWISILLLVLLVAFKDVVLSAFSYLKMPLDAIAEILHTTGWFVGLIYLGTAAFGADPPANETASLGFAAGPDGGLGLAGDLLTWLLMAVVHTAVWIVFNTVEVLIILNPVPYVDTALKSIRTFMIAVLALAAQFHPFLGFAVALPVILLSFWFVRWAWRFLLLGWTFSYDTIRGWFRKSADLPLPVRAFASWSLKGVPLFACGTVERRGNTIDFIYRKWLFFRKVHAIDPTGASVSSGVLSPLLAIGGNGVYLTLLRFPPRYVGHETQLASHFGLGDPADGSFQAGFRAIVRQLGTLFRPAIGPAR